MESCVFLRLFRTLSLDLRWLLDVFSVFSRCGALNKLLCLQQSEQKTLRWRMSGRCSCTDRTREAAERRLID
ncbi:uncharacterized protein V6R79_000723 [Siganus canaliculatus]